MKLKCPPRWLELTTLGYIHRMQHTAALEALFAKISNDPQRQDRRREDIETHSPTEDGRPSVGSFPKV